MKYSSLIFSVLLTLCMSSCDIYRATSVSTEIAKNYTPTYFGDSQSLLKLKVDEIQNIDLVATNLVSVFLQIPELESMSTTFQVAHPSTAFGNILIKALEDAGIALQLVTVNRSANHLSYRHGASKTGKVVVFSMAVNNVELSREFMKTADGIFPASLASIKGTDHIDSIAIDDSIFAEQGGDESFLSGIRSDGAYSTTLHKVKINEIDHLPDAKRTSRMQVVKDAKRTLFHTAGQPLAENLSSYKKHRRTVFKFVNQDSLVLGRANKRSMRLMVREFEAEDILLIQSCNDVDGVEEIAEDRAIRVKEEFVHHDVPIGSILIAPCTQTKSRLPAVNSRVPVKVIHYRPRV